MKYKLTIRRCKMPAMQTRDCFICKLRRLARKFGRLDDEVRAEFESLGSSYIRRLAMRDSWAFVGQKGLKGRSTIEELEFAPTGGGTWSNSVDKKLCVPLHIKGFTLKFDTIVDKNVKRDDFCSRFVSYGDFCSSENRFGELQPAPMMEQLVTKNYILTVPLLIVAGSAKNDFRMQLESVLGLPGIDPKMVKVFYNESIPEYSELIGLFGFNAVKVTNASTYNDLVQRALQDGWVSSVEYVILLEEEVFPTTDFLSFMDQCLEILDTDGSLIGVSAWNENGYVGISNNASVAYRTETFPGLGLMLKRSFYDMVIRSNWSKCCDKRSWEGWLDRLPEGSEMIIPEISRVTRQPYDGIDGPSEILLQLFNRRRTFSNGNGHRIVNAGMLSKIGYEADLQSMLKTAVAVEIDSIQKCVEAGSPESLLPANIKRQVLAIFYEQRDITDEDGLSKLCRCFQLFSLPGHRVRGKHRGIVRFSFGENQVLLIGSATDYYRFMPSNHKPLKIPSDKALKKQTDKTLQYVKVVKVQPDKTVKAQSNITAKVNSDKTVKFQLDKKGTV